jgi:hypothetical protein
MTMSQSGLIAERLRPAFMFPPEEWTLNVLEV